MSSRRDVASIAFAAGLKLRGALDTLAPWAFVDRSCFAPTPEAEFKHVLEYTERQRFKFKLSKWQCRDLVEAMCRHDAKLRAKRLSDELSLGRP